jgi:hypothetical protein
MGGWSGRWHWRQGEFAVQRHHQRHAACTTGASSLSHWRPHAPISSGQISAMGEANR